VPLCAADARRAAWAVRRRDRPALDAATVVRLYEDGCSAAGIGRSFDYSAAEVTSLLRSAEVQVGARRVDQACAVVTSSATEPFLDPQP
jgi:DNA-binding CsgD family transcriptional regulator